MKLYLNLFGGQGRPESTYAQPTQSPVVRQVLSHFLLLVKSLGAASERRVGRVILFCHSPCLPGKIFFFSLLTPIPPPALALGWGGGILVPPPDHPQKYRCHFWLIFYCLNLAWVGGEGSLSRPSTALRSFCVIAPENTYLILEGSEITQAYIVIKKWHVQKSPQRGLYHYCEGQPLPIVKSFGQVSLRVRGRNSINWLNSEFVCSPSN